MLIDAILKLHDQVQHTKLGANRAAQIVDLETERSTRCDLRDEGPAAMSDEKQDKQVEQPAVEQSPENVPAPVGDRPLD